MTASILLLDNKDSFVWNLAQALGSLGCTVDVVRSDRLSPAEATAREPDAIVVSPGPGRPSGAGNSLAILRATHDDLPILGICLGHQALGEVFGGRIVRVPPCHGKPWPIFHQGTGLFEGLPNPLHACRYHSLALDPDSIPDGLEVDATTPEGIVMSLRRRDAPVFGLQFHPESFRTEHGLELLSAFLRSVPAHPTPATRSIPSSDNA